MKDYFRKKEKTDAEGTPAAADAEGAPAAEAPSVAADLGAP